MTEEFVASIVIPAYNEGPEIVPGLLRLIDANKIPSRILVVVDRKEDSTIPFVDQVSRIHARVTCLVSELPPGPANAIKYGVSKSNESVVVVTMADGCDDPKQVDELIRLVLRGVAVAAASRYMPGGQQVGGPRVKKFLSKIAGKSLHLLANVGTRDATNSFKAYSREFLDQVSIESQFGFEMGLELTAKANRLRLPIAEIPTIWLDRTFGQSNFKLAKWIPKYMHWYFHAFGKEK